MKKITLTLAAVAGAMLLTGCGTTGNSSVLSSVGQSLLQDAVSGITSSSSSTSQAVSNGTSVLENLLSGVLGSSSKLTQSDLVGTWNYTGADCVFESENLLAKAGGAVAASKIESQMNTQLAKVGIKQGACSFTFNKDNTYTATIGGKTISGNYTLNSSDKTVKMTYLAGLGSMTPHIAKTGNKLSILMEGEKLLKVLKTVSAVSGSSTLSTVSSLLGNYDGLYVGMQLSK